MGTTPTVPKRPIKRRLLWQFPAGLALSLGAFAFGAFMALPALLAIVPGLRRFWIMGAVLFLGVLGVRGLALMGVNPLLEMARADLVAELEDVLGGEVRFESFEGDAPSGRLLLRGVTADVPAVDGRVKIDELEVRAGFALLYRPDGFHANLRNLRAELDPAGGKLERYLAELRTPGGVRANVSVEDGRITLKGDRTSAVVHMSSMRGDINPDVWNLEVTIRRADLTLLGRTHNLDVQGGLSLRGRGGQFTVQAAMGIHEPELGRAMIMGSLSPGGQEAIRCTVDNLELNPLWARYRKIDRYYGRAQGEIWISGDLSALSFDFDLAVHDYAYYHRAFMDLDRARMFHLPEAAITGGITIHEGNRWEFRDVSVDASTATLATGPRMNAVGGGRVVLRGVFPALAGTLKATVIDGEINRAISWSGVAAASLRDVQPNLVMVGEQFPSLKLDWEVDVQSLRLNCAPLSGELAGQLAGTFRRTPDAEGELRAEGELEIQNGRFAFCAASGEVTGRVIFQPNQPTWRALIRGGLKGSVGDTDLDAEISGGLTHPAFTFHGVTMRPELLGRKIVTFGDGLTRERREELVRLCGPASATNSNPFDARSTGNVSFKFSP